jgi:alpha-ribazole phosphatase
VPADPAATYASASAFAGVIGDSVAIWTSPSSRARQLAHRIADLRPAPVACREDARLREMDFGCWEMQPWDQIPRAAFDAWTADFALHRFGGKECVQDVLDRVAQALDEARASGAAELVWVTHGGVIRAALFLAGGGRRPIHVASEWPAVDVPMGTWVCLDV